MQRKLARQVLVGILNRRDTVVCCQPYCTLLASTKDNIFAESATQRDLSMFKKLHNQIYSVIRGGKVKPNDQALLKKELNASLMTALLFITPADLPPQLPLLIVSGLYDKYASIEALELTKAYLFSQIEEFVSNTLADGTLGIFGLPALLSPHGRREHVTYDEHITNSLSKLQSLVDTSISDDQLGLDTSRYNPSEVDIMRCRYSRVDTFISSFNVVSLLQRFIVDAIKHFDIILNTEENMLTCGILSAEILQHIVRKSSDNTASVLILQLILRPVWKDCLQVLNFNVHAADFCEGSKESFSSSLALLVLSIIQTSVDMANSLWDEDFKSILLNCLTQRHGNTTSREETHSPMTKKLRVHMKLLQSYICYGMGLELLKDIFIENPAIAQYSELKSNPHSVYIYQIMEEASLACSRHLKWLMKSKRKEGDNDSSVLIVIEKILDLVVSSLFALADRHIHQTDDPVIILQLTSGFNFVSTVVGINVNMCLSPLTSVRGVGLLNHIELLKDTPLSLDPIFMLVLDRVKTIRDFSMGILFPKLLPLLSTDEDSSHDLSYHNWVQLELKCATSRTLSAFASSTTSSMTTELRQSAFHSILQETDKIFHLITSWGRTTVSCGLVGVQIDRICSIMALCALNACESIYFKLDTEDGRKFDEIDRITIHVLPYLGKLFVYNIVGLLGFFFRREIKTENVNDLLINIILGKQEVVQIDMSTGSVQHGEESIQDLQGIVEYSKQCLNFSDLGVSSTYYVHLSRHFHINGVPLNSVWPYSICLLLKNGALLSWMNHLMVIESYEKEKSDKKQSPRISPATKLTTLIYLSTVIGNETANYEEDDEILESVMEKILQLLISLSAVIPECEDFANECCKTANMLIRADDMERGQKATYKLNQSQASLVSLTERVLDSSMSLSLNHDLHASSLTVLLTPFLPWQPREMIWRNLGSLSILHLLESNFLTTYMPNLVSKVETNLAVLRSIVDALQSLRSIEDRNWIVVIYGIFQICRFLHDGENSLRSSKILHLRESITHEWLNDAVLKMVTFLPLISSCIEDNTYNQQIVSLRECFESFGRTTSKS